MAVLDYGAMIIIVMFSCLLAIYFFHYPSCIKRYDDGRLILRAGTNKNKYLKGECNQIHGHSHIFGKERRRGKFMKNDSSQKSNHSNETQLTIVTACGCEIHRIDKINFLDKVFYAHKIIFCLFHQFPLSQAGCYR